MPAPPLALLYHAVLPPRHGRGRALDRTLIVDPGEFAWQLGELRRCGYRSLTLDDYHAALQRESGGEPGVLVTFDDGYAHLHETVSPLLEAHGFTAVMFVSSEHLGGANSWDAPDDPLHAEPVVSAERLSEMVRGSWEVASHGAAHVDLRALPGDARLAALIAAREQLAAITGRPVRDLAYPYGLCDAAVQDAARAAGHRMAFAATAGQSEDHFRLPRMVVRGQEGRRAFRLRIEPEVRALFG